MTDRPNFVFDVFSNYVSIKKVGLLFSVLRKGSG